MFSPESGTKEVHHNVLKWGEGRKVVVVVAEEIKEPGVLVVTEQFRGWSEPNRDAINHVSRTSVKAARDLETGSFKQ